MTTPYPDPVTETGFALLVATGDRDKRAQILGDAINRVDPKNRDLFLGTMIGELLQFIDVTLATHPARQRILETTRRQIKPGGAFRKDTRP